MELENILNLYKSLLTRNIARLSTGLCALVSILELTDKHPNIILTYVLAMSGLLFAVIAYRFSRAANYKIGALASNVIGFLTINYAVFSTPHTHVTGTLFYFSTIIVTSTFLCGRWIGGLFLIATYLSFATIYLTIGLQLSSGNILDLSSFLDRVIVPTIIFYVVFIAEKAIFSAIEAYNEQSKKIKRGEKLSTIGIFAAGLAHEVRNPLAVIDGSVTFLAKILANPLSDEKKQATSVNYLFENLKNHVNRISDIVDSLMFLVNDSMSRQLDPKPQVNVTLVLSEYLMDIDCQDILIENLLTREEYKVAGSPYHLSTVLRIMIENAIDAVKEGTAHPPKIIIKSHIEDQNLVITIQDNGGGISEDIQPSIFDPFFTTKGAGKGSGMGLSLAHSIAERLGWSIDFSSKPGETRFFIKISHYELIVAP